MVPEGFARETVRRYGARGQAWLDCLPAILAASAARWGLTLGPPLVPLSYNYLVAARRDDSTAVILKAVAPHPLAERAFEREEAALRLFSGRGGVQLLGSDAGDQVLLLERCEPGTMLRATAIACGVMRQLWQASPPPPAAHPFPTMHDWNAALGRLRPHFGGGTGPFPARVIEEMGSLLPDLAASSHDNLLLHGDLHHDNVLAAGDGWAVIDPKGVIGEPAYEVGALLYNPYLDWLQSPDPARLTARRVDQCAAELGLDRARVRGWGLVRAVLSAWWSVEDGGANENAIACAMYLAAMK